MASCTVSACAASMSGWRGHVGMTAVPISIVLVFAPITAIAVSASGTASCASQYDANPSLSAAAAWSTICASGAPVAMRLDPLIPMRMHGIMPDASTGASGARPVSMRPMADQRPVWRQGFDAVEHAVGPRITEMVQSEQFQIAAGLGAQAQKAVQTRVERQMRRTLHLWNLPAGSDVTRILNEIGGLQRDLRALAKKVEALTAEKEASDGREHGSPRPRAAGSRP
jgi:hypothetical protein